MDSVVATILFIIALGLLICLHELGHFFFAKLFGVYCHEFSIGFGPALIHKRGKGKETYFSLRIIPVGGYVSMYGEEGEVPEEGLKLPEERSLEGIKKWKKGIIISAGIIVNTILAIIFFFVSNFCFPISLSSSLIRVTPESTLVEQISDNDELKFTLQDDNLYFSWTYTNIDGIIHSDIYAIIDDEVDIEGNKYVLTYTPLGTKGDTNLSSGLRLYHAITKEQIPEGSKIYEVYKNWIAKENAPTYFPDVSLNSYVPTSDFDVELTIITSDEVEKVLPVTIKVSEGKFQDLGLFMKKIDKWLPVSERWSNTWDDFGNASIAVFKGLGTLFSKNGIKNMSGIVGIFSYSTNLYSNYAFSTYLYFWGLISINLAIFNLLPFPGLDGWQLLVTIVEGVTRKKLPSKFKQIMSFIGMALLIVLLVVIVVFDVRRLI